MRTTSDIRIALIVVLGCMATASSDARACTGLRLTARDGAVIYARTMEDALDFQSNLIIVPRGKEYLGVGPDNKPGMRWTTKYGFVGPNALDQPYICDGLNEKGLAAGNFQFTGFANFQKIGPDDANRVLASYQVATFLLGTCGTVEEAIAVLRSVRVCELGTTPQDHAMGDFHYVLHDAGGHCAVLEYVDGRLNVHDNPLGVVTNSPPFDWQMTNLRNYIHLNVQNAAPVRISGVTLSALGQGTGLLGLPGDFTPPSRFVRAVTFTQAALPCATAEECVLEAFHLLNQFDLPAGAIQSHEEGKCLYECARWTTAADMKNLRYFFHTYQSRRIRMVDLKSVDLKAKDIKTISMRDAEVIEDVSSKAK